LLLLLVVMAVHLVSHDADCRL